MCKFIKSVFSVIFGIIIGINTVQAATDRLSRDTSDPAFLLGHEEFLSQTSVSFMDDILKFGQGFSYGATNRLSLGAKAHYQIDFDGDQDGFSSVDIGGQYRLASNVKNGANIVYDALFGVLVGGSDTVRTPYYADSTYYAGLRLGRQWSALTLAATVKSSWVFDNTRGMAYIDLMPQAYFRIGPWRLGADFMWRKATTPAYDQEWLGGKIIRQYGRTQYIGHVDYEFESENAQVGFRINILF